MRARGGQRWRWFCLALVVLVGAGWAARSYFAARPPASSAPPAVTSAAPPSEAAIGSGYHWAGRPQDPKSIAAPAIGLQGFVQAVGLNQQRQIAAPTNIHLAGWFVDSVRPGQPGLSIIDGHVDGRQADGIFRHLADLKPKDLIVIEQGNGYHLSYHVRRTMTVSVAESLSFLFSRDASLRSQLNLITCGGDFNAQSGTYAQRVIVVAELGS